MSKALCTFPTMFPLTSPTFNHEWQIFLGLLGLHVLIFPGAGLCEGLGHQKREEDCCVPVDFDWLCVRPDLAPGNSLVWARSRVTAVKLLGSIHKHGKVCAILHQIGVADMVLGNSCMHQHIASSAWHAMPHAVPDKMVCSILTQRGRAVHPVQDQTHERAKCSAGQHLRQG